jgi:PAT family beta-lactamase induction signal transducer AmpG
MYVCKGEYKTYHFAISTGLMALGFMMPGAVSSAIQQALEHLLFFIFGMFANDSRYVNYIIYSFRTGK